ncbi:MAG: hypothetical protein NZM36_06555 [Aquificaceae bacterium]|nr:hypothetical protein [Aquificaceae bacterium]
MSLLISDFLSNQLQAIYKSGLSEEAKKNLVYELIRNAKEYSLQDAQKRRSTVESVILDLFGVKPEDLLLQAQPTKAMTKDEVLKLLEEVYGA